MKLLLATNPRKPLDSGVLVQLSQDRWKLCEFLAPQCRCFGVENRHSDNALAIGTLADCYTAADKLGYHIDIITPRKDL